MYPKDFDRVLDRLLLTGKMLSEDYEAMTLEQQNIIQIIKRSLKRITYNSNQ